DAPELLAVDMDQLAGPLALVTHNHWLWFERRQLAQTEPPQDRTHRRDRHAKLAGDRRPTHPLPPQRRELTDPLRAHAMLATTRRRTAVVQRRGAAASVSGQPAIAIAVYAS